MMNPCSDYCYLRFGKQYTENCDTTCDYARVVKENKRMKEVLESIMGSQKFCALCANSQCKNATTQEAVCSPIWNETSI